MLSFVICFVRILGIKVLVAKEKQKRKESACQCRGHRFKHWSGKIPGATDQLSPWATTTEPAL